MTVKFETVMDLLEQREWATCANLAAQLLPSSEITPEQKALLHFARCRSLSNLEKYSQAIEPGQLAVYLASENGLHDLHGKALLELALCQHKVPGMESHAIETQRRFLEHFPTYKTIRDRYLPAQVNLGVYLRGAGRCQEALDQFRRTWQEAKERQDAGIAELARSAAVWEALRLKKTQEAEELIQAARPGNSPRHQALQLLDLAQLKMLKHQPQIACGHVLQAIPLIKQANSEDKVLLPRALEILHRVAEEHGDDETAIVVALLAKWKAEEDDRQDLVLQLTASIRSIALRNPVAVEKALTALGW